MVTVAFASALVCYFSSTLLFLIYLLRRSETLARIALALTSVAFAVHTVGLVLHLVAGEGIRLISFHKAMAFFSWTLVLVFLGVVLRYRLHVLGAFLLPLAFLALLSTAVVPTSSVPVLQPVFQTVWIHVTLSVLGTVGFAVAFVAGLMYIMQDRLLKSKQFNVLSFKLPPLDFLDALNQRSILLGFPLLTLGILTGAVSAQITWGSYLSWNPEQVWALITWAFYLIVLMGRITVGWRAKKAAYLTIVGFAGVVLTFLGILLKGHGPPASL
ncbi:MAG: c-type cytochrome biogenesis protein CcsB [Nitrospirae bacterium]|nr:MAG: c-type cytochrome biogenesis protein CcsB [Nitrospirota bacterium]